MIQQGGSQGPCQKHERDSSLHTVACQNVGPFFLFKWMCMEELGCTVMGDQQVLQSRTEKPKSASRLTLGGTDGHPMH